MPGRWSKNAGSSDADTRPQISLQIDELQRIAQDGKNEILGRDWFKSVKDIYSLEASTGPSPMTYRPRVDIPMLQMQMLGETAELTDNSPVIYLVDAKGNRDKNREKSLRGVWRQENYNLSLMNVSLWANLGGTGVLAAGIDPLAYNGRGTVWIDSIDPEWFDPDPTASCFPNYDWNFTTYTRPMYWDEIVMRWPDRGRAVPRHPLARVQGGNNVTGMSMPFGPMTAVGNLPRAGDHVYQLPNVRFCHTLDPTIEVVKAYSGSEAFAEDMPASKFKLRFPNGRLTIDCDGIVLYDGNNPTPHRQFPYIMFYGMPKLEGIWAPPPVRYSKSLQDFAERSMTQGFENSFRMNNGVWFLPDGSGLDADKFGGLPGEIQVYNSNSGEPKFVAPNAFPAQHLESIKYALGLAAQIQGYTEARQGEPGAGNISPDLYEAAIGKASRMTRLRARMMAVSVQKTAEMVFYMMARYMRNDVKIPSFDTQFEMVDWKAVEDADEWNAYVDPGSIEPMSAQNLRKTAMLLRSQGLLDDEETLEMLGIPGAHEIAEKAGQQRALAALSSVKGGGGSKRMAR